MIDIINLLFLTGWIFWGIYNKENKVIVAASIAMFIFSLITLMYGWNK